MGQNAVVSSFQFYSVDSFTQGKVSLTLKKRDKLLSAANCKGWWGQSVTFPRCGFIMPIPGASFKRALLFFRLKSDSLKWGM